MQINKIQNQELFCQKYWKRILSKENKPVNKLSQSFHIHEINQYLIGGYRPMAGKNIANIVRETDKDFKFFKPTDKELVLWRGIDDTEIYKHPYIQALNSKCKKLKEGEILRMREYAYATDDKEYAQIYNQDNGIMYEITVPKGSKIADDWNYTFPRESRFLCTQNCVVKEKNKRYNLIKLTYLSKQNPLTKSKKENTNDRIKNFIKVNIKKFLAYFK